MNSCRNYWCNTWNGFPGAIQEEISEGTLEGISLAIPEGISQGSPSGIFGGIPLGFSPRNFEHILLNIPPGILVGISQTFSAKVSLAIASVLQYSWRIPSRNPQRNLCKTSWCKQPEISKCPAASLLEQAQQELLQVFYVDSQLGNL